jgi:mono/diheme cytochrome c family protein
MRPRSVSGQGISGSTASRIAKHRSAAVLVGAALLAFIGAASLVIYAGIYNIGADTPHTQLVFWLLETVRERSIAVRATGVVVPHDLADAKRIAAGAGQYAEMCSSCHLAPGMKRTEISRGLYPRAPELRRGSDLAAAEEFWVVKHGVKMTGMPAWGVTHNDEILWDIVAFLRKLPDLTPAEYEALVKGASKTHDEMMQEMEMGNGHGQGE